MKCHKVLPNFFESSLMKVTVSQGSIRPPAYLHRTSKKREPELNCLRPITKLPGHSPSRGEGGAFWESKGSDLEDADREGWSGCLYRGNGGW